MKRIIVTGMALAFALGLAGLGFGADKEMAGMKHEETKLCSNVNCCGNQAKETFKGSERNKASDQQLKHVYDIKPSDG